MAEEQGPICISVINMKGGVGKTTVAAMLARYAARTNPYYWGEKIKTLAIDLDPQANLSQALMGNRYEKFLEDKSPSVVEVFRGYQPPTPDNPSSSPLDIENVVQRIGAELELIPSRFDFSDNLTNSVKPDSTVLARLIASNFQDRDLIIVDCAPTESIFTLAAYHASRYIVVPVKPEFLATIGFPLLNESLGSFRSNNRGHQIDVIGVVVNSSSEYLSQSYRAVERQRACNEIRQQADNNGWYMFENEITYSRGFPKIMRNDFSDSGHAPFIFGAFARELFDRLGF